MAKGLIQTTEISNAGQLNEIKVAAFSPVDQIISSLAGLNKAPLKMYTATPEDSKLYFAAAEITHSDGAKVSHYPLSGQVFSFGTSWINFLLKTVSDSNIFDITWPSQTTGAFRKVGFTLNASGKITALFSNEVALIGDLANINAGALILDEGIGLGWIDIVALASGYKTANASTDVVKQSDIHKLQGGGGGGSGGGGAGKIYSSTLENIGKDSFPYSHAAWMDLSVDKQTKTDVTSTSVFDVVTKTYKFPLGTEFLLSKNLLGEDFLAAETDIKKAMIEVFANATTLPLLQVSRNGVDFQSEALVRDGLTNRYYAEHMFTEEVADAVSIATSGGNSTLGASPSVVTQSFSLTATTFVKKFTVGTYKQGSILGSVNMAIKNSLGDIIATAVLGVDSVDFGADTNDIIIGQVLKPGSYTVEMRGDSLYSSTYTVSNNIAFYGLAQFILKGRALDLRVKISGASDVIISGAACYFGVIGFVGLTDGQAPAMQEFSFSGELNTNSFLITDFNVVPKYLEVQDISRGLVYNYPAFGAAGQTISFQQDMFLRPNETVALRFVQRSKVVDSNDANASAIAAQAEQLNALGGLVIQPYTIQDATPVQYTTIQNRAPVSNSLKVVGPSERIMFRSFSKLAKEFGPNGETVYELDNKDPRVRIVGTPSQSSGANGNSVQLSVLNDFHEIRFFGTGLNILVAVRDTNPRDIRATVDGGVEGSNLIPTGTDLLTSRSYNANEIIQAVDIGVLDWHTVKLRNNFTSPSYLSGVEIINKTNSLAVCPGTAIYADKKEVLTSMVQTNFNAGVVGTRGARIVKYIKDNVISQAVTEVDSTTKYLTNTDHANEEIDRIINFREFGVQRADDLSTVGGPANATYVLDDNCTGINGYQVMASAALDCSTSGYIVIHFIGCGIDIIVGTPGAAFDNFATYVDGVSIGNVTGSVITKKIKICSGLTYGSHTLVMSRSVNANAGIGLRDIVIYKPKKGVTPSKAIELADFCIPSSYVRFDGTGMATNLGKISAGVIRKMGVREIIYIGTWLSAIDVDLFCGFDMYTTTSGSYYDYNFQGTGIEVNSYSSNTASNQTYVITNSLGQVINLASYTTNLLQGSTGLSFNASTGVLSGTSAVPSRFSLSISGLPFGVYKIRATQNVNGGSRMYCDSLDVIGMPCIYNNPKVGGTSLRDMRYFSPIPKTVDEKRKISINFDGVGMKINKSVGVSQVVRTAAGNFMIYSTKRAVDINTNAQCSNQSSLLTVMAPGDPSRHYISLSTTAGVGTDTTFQMISSNELLDEDLRALEQ